MSKKKIKLFFISIVLLSSSILANASSLVSVTLPESKTYTSTNLLLDFNVDGPISSAYYSLNNENSVSMDPVLLFNMESIDGIVPDFSPYKNDGQTVYNVVYTSNGKYGGALVFDNYNSYVNVPDSDSLDVVNAFTISAWIYPSSINLNPFGYEGNNPGKIIEKKGSYFLDFIKPSVSNAAHINFGFYGQTMCETGIPSKPFDFCVYMIPSISSIPMDQWTHVAGTYDGTTMRLFINGVEDNRQEWLNIIVNKTINPLTIGSDITAAYTFNGIIDEVRVYSTSLALKSWVSVLNPSFENPSTQQNERYSNEYYTDYWRAESCDEINISKFDCSPEFYWDSTVARGGTHSMKIMNDNFDDLAWLAQNPNRFKPDVIEGRTYTEEVWIKTSNMANGNENCDPGELDIGGNCRGFRLIHLWWDSSWNNFDSHYCNYITKNYSRWTKITCTAAAPLGAVKGDFVIELYGPGTVWVDDVKFTSNQPNPKWISRGLNNVTVFATSDGLVNFDTQFFTFKNLKK